MPGKGIYDVDAFEAALAGRVADGTLLSHDLFEGIFARAGLVSDIEVVEEFPARYDVAAARQHRWARGDWQLLPWLLGRRDADGARPAPQLAAADRPLEDAGQPAPDAVRAGGHSSRWWPAGRCRCTPPSSGPPSSWRPSCCRRCCRWLAVIVPRRTGITARSHLRALGKDLWLAARQTAFQVTFLPHQAWLMADAIGRTLYRLFVSHRNLLEWVTAAQASRSAQSRTSRASIAAWRAASPRRSSPRSSCTSPEATRRGSRSRSRCSGSPPRPSRSGSAAPRLQGRNFRSTAADARALRLVARRTWRYFETFVTAEDHQLPPDNFQEDPNPVLAHRTSPTNIGLYLLAAVSARDFGWVGTIETVERLEATLATLDRLQRFRGHFYNWYDTGDLRPLDPRYVSPVDSGNLAAHLIALANAAREWVDPADGEPGRRGRRPRRVLLLARGAARPACRVRHAACRLVAVRGAARDDRRRLARHR